MIVRVLTARVKPGEANQFNALIRKQLSFLREQPGLVYAKLARRFEAGGGEEVILVEEWRDTDAVYGWAGPDLSKPRVLPGWEELLTDLHLAHYEALDVEDDEQAAPWGPASTLGRANPG